MPVLGRTNFHGDSGPGPVRRRRTSDETFGTSGNQGKTGSRRPCCRICRGIEESPVRLQKQPPSRRFDVSLIVPDSSPADRNSVKALPRLCTLGIWESSGAHNGKEIVGKAAGRCGYGALALWIQCGGRTSANSSAATDSSSFIWIKAPASPWVPQGYR